MTSDGRNHATDTGSCWEEMKPNRTTPWKTNSKSPWKLLLGRWNFSLKWSLFVGDTLMFRKENKALSHSVLTGTKKTGANKDVWIIDSPFLVWSSSKPIFGSFLRPGKHQSQSLGDWCNRDPVNRVETWMRIKHQNHVLCISHQQKNTCDHQTLCSCVKSLPQIQSETKDL